MSDASGKIAKLTVVGTVTIIHVASTVPTISKFWITLPPIVPPVPQEPPVPPVPPDPPVPPVPPPESPAPPVPPGSPLGSPILASVTSGYPSLTLLVETHSTLERFRFAFNN
ncbi:hypothetical protein SD70_19340 [Gordoniibacillus kamchatkensis]|uniref:Uncharacterized protein n=1 Tax=Gordoniibacillus kamchatkensis TaxID=1590651 RepID=A0ABR5AF29_9BACL|nr:hypothetical protein SD70_19340 [Paenibacillus sp. VKM B-2647]